MSRKVADKPLPRLQPLCMRRVRVIAICGSRPTDSHWLENQCQWIFALLDQAEEVLINESLGDGRERPGFRILGWALSPEIPGE